MEATVRTWSSEPRYLTIVATLLLYYGHEPMGKQEAPKLSIRKELSPRVRSNLIHSSAAVYTEFHHQPNKSSGQFVDNRRSLHCDTGAEGPYAV